jgi:hypothetical protein
MLLTFNEIFYNYNFKNLQFNIKKLIKNYTKGTKKIVDYLNKNIQKTLHNTLRSTVNLRNLGRFL